MKLRAKSICDTLTLSALGVDLQIPPYSTLDSEQEYIMWSPQSVQSMWSPLPVKRLRYNETDVRSKVRKTHHLVPEEPLSTARSQLESNLQQTWADVEKSASPSVKRNFRAIRAILSTNTETWDRCKKNLREAIIRPDGDVVAYFGRYQFTSVKATTPGNDRLYVDTNPFGPAQAMTKGDCLDFRASKVMSEKLFYISELCICPNHLRIFQLEYLDALPPKGIYLIDYESLLARSLVLNSATLEPFLLTLKTHLETVQILLRRIDDWLKEAQTIRQFVESSLGQSSPFPHGSLCIQKQCNLHGTLNFQFKVSEADGRESLTRFLDYAEVR